MVAEGHCEVWLRCKCHEKNNKWACEDDPQFHKQSTVSSIVTYKVR